MHEKKAFSKRAEEFLNGKGFYIVLFVCIAVIGVSAWLLLFSEFSPLNIDEDRDYIDVMADGSVSADVQGDTITPPTDANTDTSEVDDRAEKPVKKQTDKPSDSTLKVEPTPENTDNKEADREAEPEQNEPAEKTVSDMVFIWPVAGSVSTGYSPDKLIFDKTMSDWRTHDGVDVAAEIGTKVMTVADGTVVDVTVDQLYGTTVIIDHGAGLVSTYSNLAATPTVAIGDNVTMGSVIGSVGDTALAETGDVAHLHFSMTASGDSVNPADYLPKR